MNGGIFDMYTKRNGKSANIYSLFGRYPDESTAKMKARMAVFITDNVVVESSNYLKFLNQSICDAVREQRSLYGKQG